MLDFLLTTYDQNVSGNVDIKIVGLQSGRFQPHVDFRVSLADIGGQ